MFRAVILVVLAGAPAWAQKTVELRVGEWRASYSVYTSAEQVCDAESQWLAEELHSVSNLLDAFLEKGTTRRGAWSENDLPLLEQGAKVLPAAVAAQEFTLNALSGCSSLVKSGRFPEILARGQKLLPEAKNEIGRLEELARFTRKRVAVEKWEKQRVEAELLAAETCKGVKAAEAKIALAWMDDLGVRRWKFCDGARVEAVPNKPWDYVPPEGKPRDAKRATLSIQTARTYPESAMLKAP